MKRSKIAKRAFTLSIISIFICILMLIGSTFAWFTDTVNAGKNKIQAGNLDVTLWHSKSDNTKEVVKEDTELFKIDVWEPGSIAYEKFEVSNDGNLALKYKLAMNIKDRYNTILNTNQSLKDVLKVAIYDGEWTGRREDALKLTFDKTLENFVKDGILTEGTNNNFTVFIYWAPSENDNAYNLNGGKVASDGSSSLFINLGIELTATQKAFEDDHTKKIENLQDG